MLKDGPGHMLKDGLWRGGPVEAVMMPNDSDLREAIVLEAHRQGHFGMTATYERVFMFLVEPWRYDHASGCGCSGQVL